jgi:hypothetical protein
VWFREHLNHGNANWWSRLTRTREAFIHLEIRLPRNRSRRNGEPDERINRWRDFESLIERRWKVPLSGDLLPIEVIEREEMSIPKGI